MDIKYEINVGPIINGRGVAQYPRSNNRTCYGGKEEAYTVTANVQAVEVDEKKSKEAAAVNSQLTVSTATNVP